MKKLLSGLLAALCISGPVLAADPEIKEWNTYHSMGCMLLQECHEDIREIHGAAGVYELLDSEDWRSIRFEFDELVLYLNMAGVGVFIADDKYFPNGHRGAYHTPSNNFFLNEKYMHSPGILITVTRHEGWHAAQDCMAGSIRNSSMAIIFNEEEVPDLWQVIGRSTYKKGPLPWEKEALWAGHTKGMTVKALKACVAGEMWKVYKPTPMTRAWLVKHDFMTAE